MPNTVSSDYLLVSSYIHDLASAVVEVISNFYVPRTSIVNFYQAARNVSMRDEQDDIIDQILNGIQFEILVTIEPDLEFESDDILDAYNVFFIDGYESFERIFKKLNSDAFEFQGYYLVVITSLKGNHLEDTQKILEAMWSKHIVNVNVIFKTSDKGKEDILMYTYYPFTSAACEKVFLSLLTQFNLVKRNSDFNYFPHKTKKLHGCPIKVAAFNVEGFMMLERLEDGTIFPNGIDGLILRLIANDLNFKYELVIPENDWGVKLPNGTFSGATGLILSGKVNMSLGHFMQTAARNSLMKGSMSYHIVKYAWIVPPGQEYSEFEKLVMPFGYVIWLCVAIVYILAALIILIVNQQAKEFRDFVYGRNNKSPGLNIVNITFGGSLNKIPTRNFARFLMMLFIIYCYILRNAYQGGMLNFLRKNMSHPKFSNFDELYKSNFTFYASPSAKTFIFNLKIPDLRWVNEKFSPIYL